ncbi:MAG: GlsB/YeaQ/YmgE family stress response membrane protein [Anaerolineae bacterium]
MINLIVTLIVGAVIGWLAGMIVQTKSGLIIDILVGVFGAFLAGFIFGRQTFLNGSFNLTSLFYSFLGALLLMFMLKAVLKGVGD